MNVGKQKPSLLLPKNFTKNKENDYNESPMRMKNVAVHSIQSKSSEISNVNVDTTSVIEKFLNKYFLMEWKEQVEDLLKLKSKASKYNLRARCEEQLDIIKKLKMNLKRILTEQLQGKVQSQLLVKELEQEDKLMKKTLLEYQNAMKNEKMNKRNVEKKLENANQELKIVRMKKDEFHHEENRFMEENNRLSKQVIQLEYELKDVEKLYKQQLDYVEKLKCSVKDLEKEMEGLKVELDEKRNAEKSLKDEYEKRSGVEIQGLKKDFEQKVKKLEDDIRDAKSNRKDAVEKLTLLENSVMEKQNTIGKVTDTLHGMEKDYSKMQQQGALDTLRIKELQERLERKETEVSSALSGLRQVQEFANAANQGVIDEKKSLQEKLSTTQQKLDQLVNASTATSIEKQRMETQIQGLEEKLKIALEETQKFKLQAENSSTLMHKHDREATVQRELRTMLETQLQDKTVEFTAINAQMEAVKIEAATSKHVHSQDMQVMNDKLAKQLQEQKQQIDIVKSKNETLMENIVGLQSENDTLRESENSAREDDVKEMCQVRSQLEVLKLRLKETSTNGATSIKEKEQLILQLEEKVRQGESIRRKLHNTIQELRGNVRVFARTRPFLPSDGKENLDTPVSCGADNETLVLQHKDQHVEPYNFKFDRTFAPSTGQEDVFKEVAEFVQSAIDGYHVCLFSYGQTGSGKTHTMQGTGNNQMRGIIPRSIEKVMAQIELLKSHGWKYRMKASFLEIYNETIRDLLGNPPGNNDEHRLPVDPRKHAIKQKPGGKGLYVSDLTMIDVDSHNQIDTLMEKASRQRSVGSTDMNAQSSRSHSVFTLHLYGHNAEQEIALEGKLNLVDLAGSERLARSGATGSRLKETLAINKSLSCLSDVFAALGNKSSHVPFRNSKLTYLLQTCLSGNGKTLMMVNLSPTMASYGETLCSLRFAKLVNQCELGKAKRQVRARKNGEIDEEENPAEEVISRSRKSRGSSVPPEKRVHA